MGGNKISASGVSPKWVKSNENEIILSLNFIFFAILFMVEHDQNLSKPPTD